jgi:hypothetical protein
LRAERAGFRCAQRVNADSVLAWAHLRDARQLPDEAWAKMPSAAVDKVTFTFSDHNLEGRDDAGEEEQSAAPGDGGGEDDAASDDGSIDRSGCTGAVASGEGEEDEEWTDDGNNFGEDLGGGEL